MSTQTKSRRAASSTSRMSVVKVSRSALRASSSSSPGSWIVVSPRASASTFSATMSRAKTGWPSSAKQAAVTRPTQPTPITPIGSFLASTGRFPFFGFGFGRITFAERAMPTIWSLVSVLSRSLEIQ